jgi:predicted DNA-binding WGR domain protein
MNRVWINLEMRRYYRVVAQRDLFGDWTLVRSWGSLDNNRGQMRTMVIESYDQCMSIIDNITKRRTYRGYHSVNVQGRNL